MHAQHPLACVVACCQRRCPVVLTHHGPMALRHIRWQRPLARLVTRHADAVVYVAPSLRDPRLPPGHVIPCGVDLELFRPAPRARAREALGFDGERPLVLYVGEPRRDEKRFHLAERAVAVARRSLPEVELVLVAGREHERVPLYMSACDVLVLTSLDEGSPMVVKEALACGLPVVSTPVGDVPARIAGLDGCSLVPPEPDAIATALLDVLRGRRRLRGSGSIRRLDGRLAAARVIEVYGEAVRRWEAARRPVACVVRHDYFPENSHVRRNVEALAAAGWQPHVVCLRRRGQPRRESLGCVEVHRLPVRHRRGSVARYLWEYGTFAALATATTALLHLRRRLRVIEIDNMPDVLAVAALLPRLFRVPVVFYVMDAMPELFMDTYGRCARHPVVRLLGGVERAATTLADRVVVTQDQAREHLRARGVAERKLRVVLNTADESVFSREGVPPAAVAGAPLAIVAHGSVLERYGIHVLCASVPVLADAGVTVRVDVFGEGEYRERLARLIRQLGVADRVRLRGFVPQEELLAGLGRADLGYVGMLNNLSLPNKLMELVALRVPVVLARWPLFERYFPETTVAYFEPGNPVDLARAIAGVARDPAAACERADRAYKLYASRYAWTVQRRRYLAVHAAVARRAGPESAAPTGVRSAPELRVSPRSLAARAASRRQHATSPGEHPRRRARR